MQKNYAIPTRGASFFYETPGFQEKVSPQELQKSYAQNYGWFLFRNLPKASGGLLFLPVSGDRLVVFHNILKAHVAQNKACIVSRVDPVIKEGP